MLLVGPSGSGKSTLALELIAMGGKLVADDRVMLDPRPDGLWLQAPDTLRNQIEARGVGILTTPASPARAALVVDLANVETERLPDPQTTRIAEFELPLLRKVESPAFAAMLRLILVGDHER